MRPYLYLRPASVSLALTCLYLAFITAGCSTSSLVNQWRNPSAADSPRRSLIIVGVSRLEGIRRTFEDAFSSRLESEGVQASPSYKFIAQASNLNDAVLKDITARTGADGVLVTRLVHRQTDFDVDPGYVSGPLYGGWSGYYSGVWGGFVEPPRIYQYETAILSTDLLDPRTGTLLWSATTRTYASGNPSQVINDLVRTLSAAMIKAGLIEAGRP